jgi:hypothetical protein
MPDIFWDRQSIFCDRFCENKSFKFWVRNIFSRMWYIAACLAQTPQNSNSVIEIDTNFCEKNLWQTNSELKHDIFCTETEYLVWGPQKQLNSDQKFWATQNCSEHCGFCSEILNSGKISAFLSQNAHYFLLGVPRTKWPKTIEMHRLRLWMVLSSLID